jgi:hypothetical protein
MVRLYGREWRADALRRYVGTMGQIAGITAGERTDGAERGVRTLDVQTGSGFAFTLLPERGMDIGEARMNGIPLAWRSAMGDVHPSRHEREGRGWERSFGGGLLATCGLDNAGASSVDEGVTYPQHGRINHIPATHVRYDGSWHGDEYVLSVEGRVRQANLYGENLLLTRRIETRLGADGLTVTDTVSNEGFRPEPVLLLHHINLGFPVIDATSELLLPSGTRTTPPDDEEWRRGAEPGAESKVFVHRLPAGPDGMASLAMVNRAFDGGRGIGVAIRYTTGSFPLLWQWRNLMPGEYVMGLEPTNAHTGGRRATREAGDLRILAPGETETFQTEILALRDRDAIAAVEQQISGGGVSFPEA